MAIVVDDAVVVVTKEFVVVPAFAILAVEVAVTSTSGNSSIHHPHDPKI